MSLIKKTFRLVVQFFNLLGFYPKKRIIILSHMRSGSSLLSHILFSNPEICGIGETGKCYDLDNFHLDMIVNVLTKKRTLFFDKKGTYILDKILHKEHLLNLNFLNDYNTYTILLVRNPEEALPSILNTFKEEKKWSEEDAYNYYIERLELIISITKSKIPNIFLVDYADFLINKDRILKELSNYLNLTIPLNPNYKSTKLTGVKGIGDWSSNIHSGKILEVNEKKSSYEGILFNADLIKKARTKYDEIIELIKKQ